MARMDGQSRVGGSSVRRPSVPCCCGVSWYVRGGSSNLEDEPRSLRPASSRPRRRAWIRGAPRFRLFLVSFAGASAAVGKEAEKDNGAHFRGLVPGVGVLGIIPGDIFSAPPPSRSGPDPLPGLAALGVGLRWKGRVRATLAGQERIAFSSLLRLLISSSSSPLTPAFN